jgi:hypothetical protein
LDELSWKSIEPSLEDDHSPVQSITDKKNILTTHLGHSDLPSDTRHPLQQIYNDKKLETEFKVHSNRLQTQLTTFFLDEPQKHKSAKEKTYNSRYSLVVIHTTTNLPIYGLSIVERSGCPFLHNLWLYVKTYFHNYINLVLH